MENESLYPILQLKKNAYQIEYQIRQQQKMKHIDCTNI